MPLRDFHEFAKGIKMFNTPVAAVSQATFRKRHVVEWRASADHVKGTPALLNLSSPWKLTRTAKGTGTDESQEQEDEVESFDTTNPQISAEDMTPEEKRRSSPPLPLRSGLTSFSKAAVRRHAPRLITAWRYTSIAMTPQTI